VQGINFTYSNATSNNTLRGHLEAHHKEDYLERVNRKEWPNSLKSEKAAIAAATPTVSQKVERVPFTQENLISHLIDFITADDQVCFSSRPFFLPHQFSSPSMLWNAASFDNFCSYSIRTLRTV
jgi:hypothetical protein